MVVLTTTPLSKLPMTQRILEKYMCICKSHREILAYDPTKKT